MAFTVRLFVNPLLAPLLDNGIVWDLEDDYEGKLPTNDASIAIATVDTMMRANGAAQFVPAHTQYMFPSGTTELCVRRATEEDATAHRAISYLTRKELLTLLANTLQALEDTAAVVASSLAKVDMDRAAYYAEGVSAAKRKRLAVLTALAQLNE